MWLHVTSFPGARIGGHPGARERECARSGGNKISLHNLCAPKRVPRFPLLFLAKPLLAINESDALGVAYLQHTHAHMLTRIFPSPPHTPPHSMGLPSDPRGADTVYPIALCGPLQWSRATIADGLTVTGLDRSPR
ncbi:uncharacterized protein F4817DRAFT_270313 [Daldinia loculata]|uniref:uncharacterized protein n=1 Tax=Daldinia loculata TaxID=103429 RepID=UPI0020C3CF67|nr:uncharacterized protein F4817DRAFT_270313 [Daldinia loculata]KAI1643109.1 hypothetical protein F4817DRAFT_270313 [Daldinia loculata]